jgi:hypothetical protein
MQSDISASCSPPRKGFAAARARLVTRLEIRACAAGSHATLLTIPSSSSLTDSRRKPNRTDTLAGLQSDSLGDAWFAPAAAQKWLHGISLTL